MGELQNKIFLNDFYGEVKFENNIIKIILIQ